MTIYTPRGLKIRFTPGYAFALMSRLEPQVRPIEVLLTTEALEKAAGFWSSVVAITVAMSGFDERQLFWAVSVAGVLVGATIRQGIFVVPGLVALPRRFLPFSGWGLYLVPVVAAIVYQLGWPGVAYYVGARVLSAVVNGVAEMVRGKRLHKLTGMALSGAETNFISAYRLHSQRYGVSTNIEVEDFAGEGARAEESLLRFATTYPDIASRFE